MNWEHIHRSDVRFATLTRMSMGVGVLRLWFAMRKSRAEVPKLRRRERVVGSPYTSLDRVAGFGTAQDAACFHCIRRLFFNERR